MRARETAGHSLRKLRTVLQGTNLSLHPVQLRFRLGRAFAFSNDLHGWKNDSEIAYDIELTDATLLRANEQTASTMVEHPVKDIDKRADIALRWIERALLTGDSVISLLFLFFALEALLGDSAEGLKAHGLAFRRAMLSHVTEGTFTHPDTTYLLYDEIRSSAVHGEKVALLSEDQVRHFAGDVQRALNQYLEIATTNGMLKRAQMRRFLDQHEDVPKLIDWLRTNAHPDWEDYFERTSS